MADKIFLKSIGVTSGLAIILIQVSSLFGVTVQESEANQIAESATAIATCVFAISSIYGRWRAKTKLRWK